MEKLSDGWKVYDVTIEGISLVQTYRGTFDQEVQRGGVDGLIKAITAKNQALRAARQQGQ
jgi:phospholipid transport system substrate-binding protein